MRNPRGIHAESTRNPPRFHDDPSSAATPPRPDPDRTRDAAVGATLTFHFLPAPLTTALQGKEAPPPAISQTEIEFLQRRLSRRGRELIDTLTETEIRELRGWHRDQALRAEDRRLAIRFYESAAECDAALARLRELEPYTGEGECTPAHVLQRMTELEEAA